MVFSLETAESVPASDLPEDFFELTIDDAKKILRDIRKRRSEMEDAQLMTSALRNLEESKKQLRLLNRYKQAVIRVHFPDRTVLQGTFAPTDTIADIVNFVRQYLEEPNMDFYLCMFAREFDFVVKRFVFRYHPTKKCFESSE